MPIGNHRSFDRPSVVVPLWRYTDLPKFIELLTSGGLWLSNAEELARDDPYEGLPGAVQFPHRMWKSIEEVPDELRRKILKMGARGGTDGTPEGAFRSWFMCEEQSCIMTRSGRRDFYISCWHAAGYESAAMWKIYGSPGAGVAIVTNGARIAEALAGVKEDLYLGAVRYRDPAMFEIGTSNAFDPIMVKRASYSYEQEVRLVHWHISDYHDALAHDSWNNETMRYDNLIEDLRPICPGLSLPINVDALIQRVVISPFAPTWYEPMITRLRDKLGYNFKVEVSQLLVAPIELG